MTKLRSIRTLSMMALLGATAVAACGDDDDSVPGGGAGQSHAGSTTAGTQNTNEGGEPGGPSLGGAPNLGGTTALGGASPAAGAEHGGAEHGGVAGEMGAAGSGGASAVAALSDAQILLVLDTLNQGEVEEAYAAIPRLESDDVKAFAQQMVTDHSSARQAVLTTADTLDLAPLPSEPQAKLARESDAHVAMLRDTPASTLDATYIDMQVAAHTKALALLDDLAEAADAAELDTLIGTLRAAVEQHHDDAQVLQGEL